MILASSIYTEIEKDVIDASENGRFSIDQFNRNSKRAEIDFLNWLTGQVDEQHPLFMFSGQKNKDWLTHLITTHVGIVEDGKFYFPSDYYGFENLFYITGDVTDCSDEELKVLRKPVELLDGSNFAYRVDTWIDELKEVAIAKQLSDKKGKYFFFNPFDIGNAYLEYIRMPRFAVLNKGIDPQFNDEVPVEAGTVNYEWDEWARPYLIYLISSYFGVKTREQALQQQNEIIKKPIT